MIRQAEARDWEGVLFLAHELAVSFEIEHGAFVRSWDELIVRSDAYLLIAEESGRIVAYLLGFKHPTSYANGLVGWVEEVMVDESRRRNGLGRELMARLEE